MKRSFLIYLLLTLFVPSVHHAEEEQQLLERIDSHLVAGNMLDAISARAAWLALDLGARLSAPLSANANPKAPTPEDELSSLKAEFDRLYANRLIKYKRPTVPAKWSALKDAYEFGHAKGVFNAICSDLPMLYHGSGERSDAFDAGYGSGRKLGRALRR